ncbi:ATP-dependent DNA ligase [[Kitasatospora] papulosa]
MPAHFIAFDVLQSDGQELLNEPFVRRREALATLFTHYRLVPPWTLCPSTTDPATADEWLYEWTDVPGVEGVVIKNLTGCTGWACAAGPRSAAGTPPKHSSAPSPAPCTAPKSCSWVATTPPAAYAWGARTPR